MLDLGRPESLAEAVQTARMIEDSGAGIYWWEEPLSSADDAENMAALTARTGVRIAAGESDLTAFAFRDLIERRVVDLLQPDLSWVGGLTEGRRIAEMARLANVPVVPAQLGHGGQLRGKHSPGGGDAAGVPVRVPDHPPGMGGCPRRQAEPDDDGAGKLAGDG